jgi:hypothetical protein
MWRCAYQTEIWHQQQKIVCRGRTAEASKTAAEKQLKRLLEEETQNTE